MVLLDLSREIILVRSRFPREGKGIVGDHSNGITLSRAGVHTFDGFAKFARRGSMKLATTGRLIGSQANARGIDYSRLVRPIFRSSSNLLSEFFENLGFLSSNALEFLFFPVLLFYKEYFQRFPCQCFCQCKSFLERCHAVSGISVGSFR